jgi:predicted nucleic-acid-binding Zn-ribbon protein
MNPNVNSYAFKICPECNSSDWVTSEGSPYGLVQVDNSTNSPTIKNDLVFPVLPIVCRICGYTKFYMDGSIFHFVKPV